MSTSKIRRRAIRLGTGMLGAIPHGTEALITVRANELTEGTKPLRTDITYTRRFGTSNGSGHQPKMAVGWGCV